jgi:hypothetical protein
MDERRGQIAERQPLEDAHDSDRRDVEPRIEGQEQPEREDDGRAADDGTSFEASLREHDRDADDEDEEREAGTPGCEIIPPRKSVTSWRRVFIPGVRQQEAS